MSRDNNLTEVHEEAPTRISRRELEMQAGRERMQSRQDAKGLSDRDKEALKRLQEQAKEQEKEDNERLRAFHSAPGLMDKAFHDRAGSLVIDQAQTELEAVGHLADREEKILTADQQLEVELLEGNADPEQAREVTVSLVTAQAVNQPTILANELHGYPTEEKPLNTSGMSDRDVAIHRARMPTDREVPKTRKQAERKAKGMVPPTEEVVREAAVVSDDKPEENRAMEIVANTDDEILS